MDSKEVNNRKQLGNWGEKVACNYLKKQKRFKILDTNYRKGHGEIDIIASKENTIIFVEVRTRRNVQSRLNAYWSIGHHKKKVLRKTALFYLKEKRPRRYRTVRFDIITVEQVKEGEHRLTHWENVGLFGCQFS